MLEQVFLTTGTKTLLYIVILSVFGEYFPHVDTNQVIYILQTDSASFVFLKLMSFYNPVSALTDISPRKQPDPLVFFFLLPRPSGRK